MKIVAPVKTQQTSLGRHDTSVTAQAGEVAKIKGMTEGLTQAFVAMSETTARLNDIRSERQSQQADLYMQKSDKEFWDQWGGRDFFDVDEIPDHFITEGMMNKGRVMSSEVLPEMYADHIKDQIPEAARIIETDSYRNTWNNRAQESAIGRQISIQNRANAETQRQIFEDEQINYKNAEDTDRPDLMLDIANKMHGTPDQVEPFIDKARKRAETYIYDEAMIEEDAKKIEESITYLRQDANVYHSDNGKLNDHERRVWISKLETEQNRLAAKRNAGLSVDLSLIRRRQRITKTDALNGKKTDMDDYGDLFNQLSVYNSLSSGQLADEIEDMKMGTIFADLNNNMILMDRDSRDNFILGVKGADSSLYQDFEKRELLSNLEQSNASITAAENRDMMQSAVDSGAVPFLTDVNLKVPPEELQTQLLARKAMHDSLFANYQVTQGIFTQDESVKLSNQLNDMTPLEQMSFITSVSNAFGTEAKVVYDQLQLNGSSDTLSIAGTAALNGNTAIAHHMLVGTKYRKENGEEMKMVEPLIDAKVLDHLGSAYDRAPRYKASLKTAIKDAYIGLSINAGENLKALNTGGWFGTNYVDMALDATTGGMLKYNGAEIPTPEYGMTQDTFDFWLDRLDPSYIDTLGGVGGGLSSEKLLKELQDGDTLRLTWAGPNEYVVVRTNGVPVANQFGTALILKYDSNAPTSPHRTLTFQEFMGRNAGKR